MCPSVPLPDDVLRCHELYSPRWFRCMAHQVCERRRSPWPTFTGDHVVPKCWCSNAHVQSGFCAGVVTSSLALAGQVWGRLWVTVLVQCVYGLWKEKKLMVRVSPADGELWPMPAWVSDLPFHIFGGSVYRFQCCSWADW